MSTASKRFLGYCLVWAAVILLSLAGSYFNAILLDAPFHLKQELPFIARWLVWIPLTVPAIALAGKMNYAGNKASNFWAYHFCIYLLLCTIHVFLASLTARGINELLSQPADYITILKKCALTGLFYNFIVYSVILLLINGRQYYRDFQSEKLKTLTLEKSLSDTRLQFLQQQLQPHFLFNTHHSIITLIKMGEQEKAAAMLEKLSELMRIAIREANDQKVPLNKEIETLQLYVGIQQTRFEDKMSVAYAITDNTREALVPSMILQPLVENSIKYAVEQSAGATSITINASEEDDILVLSVIDSGRGRAGVKEIKKGTGLSNSEERLHKLYGSGSLLSIRPHGDGILGGTEVTIKMPLQYAAM